MLSYIEYLNMPTKVVIVLVTVFLIMQIVGETLEFKGKVVPEFIKVRKYFARKRQERETLSEVRQTMNEVQQSLREMNAHYSDDNIKMRDNWIKGVNEKLERHDEWVREFSQKLDKNNEDTLELLIENMRSTIISFASVVSNPDAPVTREQFNRVFKIYQRYENVIEENGLTNGEVDIAHRIIMESYEQHTRNHTFIEDVRGYEN